MPGLVRMKAPHGLIDDRVGTERRSPWTSLTAGERDESRVADDGFRVTAYIVYLEGEKDEWASSARRTLPPCLPVAPITTIALDMMLKKEKMKNLLPGISRWQWLNIYIPLSRDTVKFRFVKKLWPCKLS